MLKTVTDEIFEAKEALALTDAQLRLLPDDEGLAIYQAAEAHFVSMPGRRWWWEAFQEPYVSLHFPDGQGWHYLSALATSADERVWFIAEASALPFYPVYEASVATIQAVIGECSALEYYVISKDFDWLLCESHHDVMYAIGEPVSSNRKTLAEQLQLSYRHIPQDATE